MAKPKRRCGKHWGDFRCLFPTAHRGGCKLAPKPKRPPQPTDTERLDALLRLGPRVGFDICVWPEPGLPRRIRTRRDIDKLLREEGKRGK